MTADLVLVTCAERPDLRPEMLAPVRIDCDRDIGEYVEPACWVRHRTPG